MYFLLLALPLVTIAGSLVSALPTPEKRATVCNGHAELCSRSYGSVTFLGAHDSFAYSDNPLDLAADQEVDMIGQLNVGARLLQAQSHINDIDGELHFCHTSCWLYDYGTVQDYLSVIDGWLRANPNEVLTFIFTNPDGASLPDVWAPAFENSGIVDFVYTPPTVPMKQSDWPTLGELIDSGKRLIVFLDHGADTDRSVPYLLPEFEMIWETPFSVTDPSFPCKVDRIAGPLDTTDHMYMINHSLNKDLFGTGIIISDPDDAGTTNSVSSILANAAGCEQFSAGRPPNFVLLDFVDIGQGMQAVNLLNGL